MVRLTSLHLVHRFTGILSVLDLLRFRFVLLLVTSILRSFQFGESQKLRLVRILRSTVMVRVGGGWVALDEFLVKNDPCRGKTRRGRR